MPKRLQVRELSVWANGAHVGAWRLPSRGAMEFTYDAKWVASDDARPLSLSMPLTADRLAHRGEVVEAYFDNLLPDSDPIRRRLQNRFHTTSRDAFDLLAAIGRDCVGAVQILPSNETPADVQKIEAQPLNDATIARELGAVVSPAGAGEDDADFRISIAGAQEKTAFLRQHGKWCRPLGSTPTTHIFKLPLGLVGNRQADMRTSVENEWLCAKILAAFGLPVASCDIGEFGPQKVLVVERFDRQLHASGKYWLRLMQEDLCQATGTPWHRKYQTDGGPGVLDIARVLKTSAQPGDLATLFQSQVLFYLLAATDGHAKNFSIRLLARGLFQLTPLYDVLSAWPIIGKRANELPIEKVKLAMALPGERPHYHLKAIQRRHFETLARKLGLGAEAAGLIDAMLERTPKAIATVEKELPKGFPADLFEKIVKGMEKNAAALK